MKDFLVPFPFPDTGSESAIDLNKSADTTLSCSGNEGEDPMSADEDPTSVDPSLAQGDMIPQGQKKGVCSTDVFY